MASISLGTLIDDYVPGVSCLRRPFLIAEAGVNHGGDMHVAYRLIDEAKEGGADAIKFQSYKASTLACKASPSYWDLSKESTTSQYELFSKYDSFWKSEFELLASHCSDVGIEFLSTPFDFESANFLSPIMSAFKVSSSDLNNHPFISYLCEFGKPILLSTGASFMWEVQQTCSLVESMNCNVGLLHCILNYPTLNQNANLAMIKSLDEKFPNNIIGYSDHTMPEDMHTLEVSVLLGASIIEKHFTHDKSLPGNDHYHAMDMRDLKLFRKRLDNLFLLLGSSNRQPLESELVSRSNARRSIISANEIPAGKCMTKSDFTFKRPGIGIDPRNLDLLVGKVASKSIPSDTIIKWHMIDDTP